MDNNNLGGPDIGGIVSEPKGYDIDEVRELRLKTLIGSVIMGYENMGPRVAVVPAEWNGHEVVVLAVVAPEAPETYGMKPEEKAVLPVAILLGRGQELGIEVTSPSGRTVVNPRYGN